MARAERIWYRLRNHKLDWNCPSTRQQQDVWHRRQPHLSMEDWMLVASDEATAGSVMAKQLLISPRSRGSSHSRFCSIVPYLCTGINAQFEAYEEDP